MRDIFWFRFWNKKRKMYYAEQDVERCSVWVGFKTGVGCVLDGGDDYVIEQCTGIKDKNGKLIYENDVITCGDDRKWVVFWRDSLWQVREIRQDGCININALTWCTYDELEVIGNIHEGGYENH